MMVEFFRQGLDAGSNAESMAGFLNKIGISAASESVRAEDFSEKWSVYPNEQSFLKVIVPEPMLSVHRQSHKKLRELMGEVEPPVVRQVNPERVIKLFSDVLDANSSNIFREVDKVDGIAARSSEKEKAMLCQFLRDICNKTSSEEP
jgi:hypothetical protein